MRYRCILRYLFYKFGNTQPIAYPPMAPQVLSRTKWRLEATLCTKRCATKNRKRWCGVVLMKIWSKARGAKARSPLWKFARVCARFCSETSHSAAAHSLCVQSCTRQKPQPRSPKHKAVQAEKLRLQLFNDTKTGRILCLIGHRNMRYQPLRFKPSFQLAL
jgi:hypothetical protein